MKPIAMRWIVLVVGLALSLPAGATEADYPDGTSEVSESSETTAGAGDLVVLRWFYGPGISPRGVEVNGSEAWAADAHSGKIHRIDPNTGVSLSNFNAPGMFAADLAFDGTSLWNTDPLESRIFELDPVSGDILSSFAAPGPQSNGLAWDGTHLWNADGQTRLISRIDPSSGAVVQSFPSPSAGLPYGLAWDGAYLYQTDGFRGRIFQVDPNNGIVLATFNTPSMNPAGLSYDQGTLWYVDFVNRTIYQLALPGVFPLVAHAGNDETVECASPLGATATLDGSRSTYSAGVFFDWFEDFGSTSEVFLGQGEFLSVGLSLGQHVITLRVTDSDGNTDTDEVVKAVVDTNPPEISATPAPAMLWPPNHRLVGVEVDAATSDACGPVSLVLESVLSSEPDDAAGGSDGATEGDIQGAELATEDLAFELRAERDAKGAGRIYTVTYRATDASGITATEMLDILVPHDQGGSAEPLMLELFESITGTEVRTGEIPPADSYAVVRGLIRNLQEHSGSYRLGSLSCVTGASPGAGLLGLDNEDGPDLGTGFFYLATYDDAGYGTESAAKDRQVPPGQGCH